MLKLFGDRLAIENTTTDIDKNVGRRCVQTRHRHGVRIERIDGVLGRRQRFEKRGGGIGTNNSIAIPNKFRVAFVKARDQMSC